jgi:glycosyltransferase involved in cell wall biosynthesis
VEDLACINCHSVTTLPLAVMLKRATGAKLIYDPHELETEANGLHGARKLGTKQVERALIHGADHYIFVGQAIEDWYRQEYGLRNTTVLYNCPVSTEVPQSDHFRTVFGIPGDKPIFLYQGLLGKGRGLEILVKAFSEIRERAALVIMGYGPLEEWVAGQAKEFANIHFHPAVPPDQLLAYTAAADFGLSVIEATSMSYEYCMPNKLFEYVMARKPVLVSPTIEQRHFVETQGVGEAAASITPEAVRQGALRLLERGPATFAAALNRARAEFCWERQESKLEAAYLHALGFRPRTECAVRDFGVAK